MATFKLKRYSSSWVGEATRRLNFPEGEYIEFVDKADGYLRNKAGKIKISPKNIGPFIRNNPKASAGIALVGVGVPTVVGVGVSRAKKAKKKKE